MNETLKVLVADDEQQIRNLCAITLKRAGFNTCSVSNGCDAAQRLTNDRSINVSLIDWTLKEKSAEQVIAEVTATIGQSIRAIITTAYALNEQQWKSIGGCAYIKKPFTPDELVTKVCEAIVAPLPATYSESNTQRS